MLVTFPGFWEMRSFFFSIVIGLKVWRTGSPDGQANGQAAPAEESADVETTPFNANCALQNERCEFAADHLCAARQAVH